MFRAATRTLLVALVATAALAVGPTVTPAHATYTSTNYESDVVKYTNVERAKRGLAKVSSSSCVDSYAEAQAARMAKAKRMYHQDLMTIARACRLRMVGENVAYGYTSGQSVTAAWMASPGHRANLLQRDYRLIGVGAVKASNGRWYVSQVFGRAA